MKNSEVWLVKFFPQVGQEIGKMRPAIIVSNERIGVLSLKIVVPLTDSGRNIQHWQVLLKPTATNGLLKQSVADCFQIKSFSTDRFVRKIGHLSVDEMASVKGGLANVLDLL